MLFTHLKINSGLEKEKAGLLGRICACFDEEALLLILTLVAYISLHGGGGVTAAHCDTHSSLFFLRGNISSESWQSAVTWLSLPYQSLHGGISQKARKSRGPLSSGMAAAEGPYMGRRTISTRSRFRLKDCMKY